MKHQSPPPRHGAARRCPVRRPAGRPALRTRRARGQPAVTNGLPTGPVVGTANTSGHKEAPPPALPGARTPDTEPAPMDRPAGDMRPNEALFDAVNRGDILAARDAIGRGADLNATNVLGLTPVELSVDLGRNDITFLLLSMRGASGWRRRLRRRKPASRRHRCGRAGQARRRPRRYRCGQAGGRRRRRGNMPTRPGTPVPQAGFLGFGGAGH